MSYFSKYFFISCWTKSESTFKLQMTIWRITSSSRKKMESSSFSSTKKPIPSTNNLWDPSMKSWIRFKLHKEKHVLLPFPYKNSSVADLISNPLWILNTIQIENTSSFNLFLSLDALLPCLFLQLQLLRALRLLEDACWVSLTTIFTSRIKQLSPAIKLILVFHYPLEWMKLWNESIKPIDHIEIWLCSEENSLKVRLWRKEWLMK